jgi:hypothetical protein
MTYELTSQFLGLVVVAHIGLGFWGVLVEEEINHENP